MYSYTETTREALTAFGIDPDAITPDQFEVARIFVQTDAEGTPLMAALTPEQARMARSMGLAG